MSDLIDKSEVRRIFRSGKSLGRSFFNTRVQHITLESSVLDIGAGAPGTASYHNVIPNFYTLAVESVDIVAEKNPTYVANIEEGIPVESASYRSCLAFNLLEHIYDYEKVLQEIYRVLTPDGKLYLVVPFLMRVHADPHDYFRYTQYTLERTLTDIGFSVTIEALGGGAMTAALSQLDFMIPRLVRGLSLWIALWMDGMITRRSGGRYRNANDYPLAYFVSAEKIT